MTERDVANEAAARAERELARARAVLEGLRREHDGALRQLQKEHGLRVEISDMVKRDGALNPGGVDVDLPVSELQRVLSQLADAADRAGELAKIASLWKKRTSCSKSPPFGRDPSTILYWHLLCHICFATCNHGDPYGPMSTC